MSNKYPRKTMRTTYEFHENGDVMACIWEGEKLTDYYAVGIHNIEFNDYPGKRLKADEFRNYFIEFDEAEQPPFEVYKY